MADPAAQIFAKKVEATRQANYSSYQIQDTLVRLPDLRSGN